MKTTSRVLAEFDRVHGKVTAHNEVVATLTEFGNELMFAVLGLETEPAGTKATFEVELRGRKRKVTVE
jgi:hypothetical protein